MKHSIAAAVILCLSAGTSAAQQELPLLTKLNDHVYVWSDLHPSGLYNTNNLIVITTDGVLVADGQRDDAATAKMVEGIGRLTRQPIRYVIICSEHGDHTGGNKAFPPGATFIKYPLAGGAVTRLQMGTTEIQVLFNGRAHTGTDLQVYLPKDRIFFVSEAFSNRIFPNMRAAVPSEWVRTVKALRKVDASTVIPGHGAVANPGTLVSELAAFERSLEHVIAEVTRVRQTGATVEGAQKAVNWGPFAAWTAADRNGPVAVQRIYDEAAGSLK
jgi:glyoxylase-like metal-dependent hydrolase (beta-lactamase superfamily II)